MKTTNKLCRLFVFAVVTLVVTTHTKAQTGAKSTHEMRDDIMQYAYDRINGMGLTMDTKKAATLLFALADDGDAEANNALDDV